MQWMRERNREESILKAFFVANRVQFRQWSSRGKGGLFFPQTIDEAIKPGILPHQGCMCPYPCPSPHPPLEQQGEQEAARVRNAFTANKMLGRLLKTSQRLT
jgi:hypothetical protein